MTNAYHSGLAYSNEGRLFETLVFLSGRLNGVWVLNPHSIFYLQLHPSLLLPGFLSIDSLNRKNPESQWSLNTGNQHELNLINRVD